jgi:hypothetical protein
MRFDHWAIYRYGIMVSIEKPPESNISKEWILHHNNDDMKSVAMFQNLYISVWDR